MIKKKKVDVYRLELYCDECNVEMIQGGYMLMSDPPKYSYSCPKCKKQVILLDQYPKIEYKERLSIIDRLFKG